MNAEAKTMLAARLRAMAEDYAEPDTNDGEDYRPDPRANDLLAAAGFLDRLPAPVEGVGLTRYGQRVAEFDNAFWVEADKDPEGDWVRHEDAAAALAAKETSLDALSSELDTANREIGNLGRRMRGYYERAEKAEAERDALKAALAPFAEALDEDDFADERLLDRDEIWEHPVAMRITFKHLRDAKRAALSPAQGGE